MTSPHTDPQTCPSECAATVHPGAEHAPTKDSQPASIGRIVLYKLADTDVARIRDQRIAARTSGNSVLAGDVFPAIVVRTWPTSVQLQVFLDGPDTYWATSVSEGDGDRQWSWPPRV